MTDRNRFIRTGRTGRHKLALTAAVSLLALGVVIPAQAQQGTPQAQPTEVSGDVALSMLEIMVKRGLLTQADADAIVAEAKTKAEKRVATVPAPLPAGTRRVQYVPEIVKREMRDEIRQEVMAQAKSEGWAAPNQVPEWAQRIRIKGDIRGRYDGTFFPGGNAYGVADQSDFNTINSGSALDIGSGTTTPDPKRNVDQDRNRFRLRARLGVEADLGEEVTTGFRIATGSGRDPVSTNQTLGGSGGNFSKYQLWLDRAFINYKPVLPEEWGLSATVGRFDNPFFSTDLIWDGDLGFDGVAVSGKYEVAKGVTPYLTLGAFPVYNTDFNLSSDQAQKFSSEDKWLFGLQAGTDWKPAKDTNLKVGAAYYHFDGIEGRLSSPCDTSDSKMGCDTDATRTPFSQKGNTMMALRNKILFGDARDNVDYQYFGLATQFRELALTGRLDYDGLKPLFPGQALQVSFDGEFVKNLGFDKKRLERGLNNKSGDDLRYDGGDTGYMLRLSAGTPKLAQRWDWRASLAYKYLESDAVVDGLTDSDFGLGGTNLKGFVIGGDLVLMPNVWTSLRWMSADNIAGSPFSVDTVLLDLTARF